MERERLEEESQMVAQEDFTMRGGILHIIIVHIIIVHMHIMIVVVESSEWASALVQALLRPTMYSMAEHI